MNEIVITVHDDMQKSIGNDDGKVESGRGDTIGCNEWVRKSLANMNWATTNINR